MFLLQLGLQVDLTIAMQSAFGANAGLAELPLLAVERADLLVEISGLGFEARGAERCQLALQLRQLAL